MPSGGDMPSESEIAEIFRLYMSEHPTEEEYKRAEEESLKREVDSLVAEFERLRQAGRDHGDECRCEDCNG